MKNYFKSIGGGNEIGASSYYVYCNGKNFLFDAGIRNKERQRYPSFSELEKLETVDTLNDLNCVFLSHGHYDHNGALPLLATKMQGKKEIICSAYTKEFTNVQLNVLKKHKGIKSYSIYEDVMVDKVENMLSDYPVGEKIEKNGYDFTFYKAGHIPGAVMTLVEVEGTKILYTGDFSDKSYPLVSEYDLPEIKDLDLLIINSTSLSKTEDSYEYTWGDRDGTFKKALKEVVLYNEVNIEVNQINNGIEIATLMAETLKNSDFNRLNIGIYVDEAIWQMMEIVYRLSPDFKLDIKKIDYEKIGTGERGIYIALKKINKMTKMRKININYSIHESYNGIKDLILKCNAKKTLITHYNGESKNTSPLIEDLNKAGYSNAVYVENEKLYEF